MKNLVLATALTVLSVLGLSSVSEATGVIRNAVFVNGVGQNVVFVRNQPFVEQVVVQRGLFGFRRVVVRRAFAGPVFVNRVTPFGTVVRVRVR